MRHAPRRLRGRVAGKLQRAWFGPASFIACILFLIPRLFLEVFQLDFGSRQFCLQLVDTLLGDRRAGDF